MSMLSCELQPTHTTISWWAQKTGSERNVTRQQTFPHMSQRSMWSDSIFTAVLSDLETIEDHITENVFNACLRKFHQRVE